MRSQRDGLIEFEENPRHRRARLVRITPRGEAVLREIQAAQQEWADALGAKLGEQDLRLAEEVLVRVREALRAEPSG